MNFLNQINRTFIDENENKILFQLEIVCQWGYYDDAVIKYSEDPKIEKHEYYMGKKWKINCFPIPLSLLNSLTKLEENLNPVTEEKNEDFVSWPNMVTYEVAVSIVDAALDTLKLHKEILFSFTYGVDQYNINKLDDFIQSYYPNMPTVGHLYFKGFESFSFHHNRISFAHFLYEINPRIFLDGFHHNPKVNEDYFLSKLNNFINAEQYFTMDISSFHFYLISIDDESEAFIITNKENEWIAFGYYSLINFTELIDN